MSPRRVLLSEAEVGRRVAATGYTAVHDIDVGRAASSGRTERKTDATEEPRDVRPHERIRPASHASGPVLPTAIVYRSYVLITSSMACSASSHAV